MQEMLFSEVPKHHSAMIDGSSFELLFNQKSFLTAPVSEGWRERINADDDGRFTRYALELLSRIVVYDHVVVDSRVLKLLKHEDVSWLNVVKTTEVPSSIYDAATEATDRIVAALPAQGREWLKSDEYWISIAKDYHDRLLQEDERHPEGHRYRLSSSLLADSTYSAPRVLYSLEIAKHVGVPLFLHPLKKDLIRKMGAELKKVVSDVFCKIEATVDKKYGRAVNAVFAQYELPIPVPTPPLMAYIFWEAESKKCSLIEAALVLRDSKAARGFRTWLREVQKKLMADDNATRGSVAKELQELSDLVEGWSKEFDSRHGVTHKRRSLDLAEAKFQALPQLDVISSLLKVLSIKWEMIDPILNRKPHWVFVSNWYKIPKT